MFPQPRSEMIWRASKPMDISRSPIPAPGASPPTLDTATLSTALGQVTSMTPKPDKSLPFFPPCTRPNRATVGRHQSLTVSTTAYAAVVVGPAHDTTTVRSAQLVDLGSGRLILVIVTSSGSIERSMIELESGEQVDPQHLGCSFDRYQ